MAMAEQHKLLDLLLSIDMLVLALDLELESWLSPIRRNRCNCWLSSAIRLSFGTESLALS
ncbi:hypothetical protein CDL15_Pgr021821 [Punica granatum]|uniref:Uncharacterized protein n=1 Tax=Punica granatum TaxID=22663 RepID=A0A218WSR7_PUNGR|nr:hypothetical protein CDL15_Pgr021821 [Punica granatum]